MTRIMIIKHDIRELPMSLLQLIRPRMFLMPLLRIGIRIGFGPTRGIAFAFALSGYLSLGFRLVFGFFGLVFGIVGFLLGFVAGLFGFVGCFVCYFAGGSCWCEGGVGACQC